jgi:hypothetical protein
MTGLVAAEDGITEATLAVISCRDEGDDGH